MATVALSGIITPTNVVTAASTTTLTNKTISGASNTLSNIPLSTSVTGTLPVTNGGTGQTTAAAAITALTGTQTSGQYLRSDGTNAALGAIQAGDVPTLNQNTTGTAANVTGTVAIANGGTNSSATATAGGVAYGTGTAIAVNSAGTSGYFLKSNGASAPSWVSAPAGVSVSTGSFTRDITTASGSQAITGVGFVPKAVMFTMSAGGSARFSDGFDTQTARGSTYTNGSATFNADARSIIVFTDGSNFQVAQIATMDSDGFTLTWTKTGSPTGSATIKYLAIG